MISERLFFAVYICFAQVAIADQTLDAVYAETMPVVDGIADEIVWQLAKPINTFDSVANREVQIRAIYNHQRIAMLVEFDDESETRTHKVLQWDPFTRIYKVGPQREDSFIFKWNMDPFATDLRLDAEKPFKADIWYWKSFRSDHAGFADDKCQVYSKFKIGKANKALLSRNGNLFYFSRRADAGTPAYVSQSPTEYVEDNIPGYRLTTPTGSRADVRARGHWQNNRWVVEFSRLLDTGNNDDVVFNTSKEYLFGISLYEIAARKPDPNITPAEYGAGEVNEHILLKFLPKGAQ